MKVNKLKKLALALGSLAIIGSSTQAFADPTTGGSPFTVDPSAILPGNTQYDGIVSTSVTGRSSELLHFTGSGASQVTSGNGYFNIGTLDPNAPIDSGLGNAYGLYLLFQLQATGAFGGPQTVTQLNFQIYADPGFANPATRTTFTPSGVTSGGVGTEAMVTKNSDDILLGYGSLLSGVAGVDSQGGLFINSTDSLALCSGVGQAVSGTSPAPGAGGCTGAYGTSFFVSPSPFYQLVFNAFNNTSQNFTPNADGTVAVSAGGTADFRNVPEPSTLALFGIAAVGLGLSARARARKD